MCERTAERVRVACGVLLEQSRKQGEPDEFTADLSGLGCMCELKVARRGRLSLRSSHYYVQ